MSISFVSSVASNNGSGFDISGSGRQAGDRCVIFDSSVAYFLGGYPPDVQPSGFTRIGSSITLGAGSGFWQRYNIWVKDLDGTEGALALMSNDQDDAMALIYRLSGGGSWGPIQGLVNNASLSGPADATTLSGSGTAPLVVVGAALNNNNNNGNNITFSPSADATQYDSQTLSTGHKIYNTSPANVTVGSTQTGSLQFAKTAFYFAQLSADTLMGQAVM